MQKKIIIFDMDGVVLDSEPLHENARAMIRQKLGVTLGPDFPDPVGASASGHWQMVLDRFGLTGDCNVLEQEQYALVARQIKENHIKPNPGLIEVLEWAKKKDVKIGLASSSTRELVEEALGLLGVRRYFDYTVSGDEVTNKKPDPEPYLRVLEMAGMTAAEAVAVEDSKNGVRSAIDAGIFCFGYRSDPAQDLSKANTTIQHLAQILEN